MTLERAYSVTVGANLGTTTTGLLAALASGSHHNVLALQLALCHCIFNICGIVLFYVLPFMRWPLFVARMFGSRVLKYKWFAIFYLMMSFFLIPISIYALSVINTILLYVVVVFSCLLLFVISIINFLQSSKPRMLPKRMRNWSFLPKQLRSFAIIDYVVQTYVEVFCCSIVERTVMLSPMRDDRVRGTLLLGNLFLCPGWQEGQCTQSGTWSEPTAGQGSKVVVADKVETFNVHNYHCLWQHWIY